MINIHVLYVCYCTCIGVSPTQVIAYAMKEYKLGLEEALAHVKELRPCINPNEGFMNQLGDYQGILRARYVLFHPSTAHHSLTVL